MDLKLVCGDGNYKPASKVTMIDLELVCGDGD